MECSFVVISIKKIVIVLVCTLCLIIDVLLLIPLENTNINIIIWGRLCWVRWGLSHLNQRQGAKKHSPGPKAGAKNTHLDFSKTKDCIHEIY
jgi:hypothetical protein